MCIVTLLVKLEEILLQARTLSTFILQVNQVALILDFSGLFSYSLLHFWVTNSSQTKNQQEAHLASSTAHLIIQQQMQGAAHRQEGSTHL